jgi:hypothetical protein
MYPKASTFLYVETSYISALYKYQTHDNVVTRSPALGQLVHIVFVVMC